MMGDQKQVNFYVQVSGRVQGVGFRYSAVNAAEKLGVKGYVKNLYNRNVEIEIEGSEDATEAMLLWCKSGPGTSRVEEVIVRPGKLKKYKSFSVRY